MNDTSSIHTAKLCSGLGQYHTNSQDAKFPRALKTITWQGICCMVDNPQPGREKSKAQWLIPSTLQSRIFSEQEQNGKFWVLWFDCDQNPHGIAALDEAVDCVVGGVDYEIYTTRSATPANVKARVLIPLQEPLSGADWAACQEVLNDGLKLHGFVPDRASERAAQLLYLPNRGAVYETRSRRAGVFFSHCVWVEQIAAKHEAITQQDAEIQAHRQVTQAARATIETGQYSRLIDAFNASYSVEEILELGWYKRRGNTFCHPNSENGSFSASVKNGRVHSLSTSDPLWTQGRGVGGHDAFSAFTVLAHGGDRRAALRDAGTQWLTIRGESWNTVAQREYNRRRQDQLLASVDMSALLVKVRAV